MNPRHNPIEIARFTLEARLVEKPSGFWLDGRHVNLDDVKRATNRHRVARGHKQIDYRAEWVL